MRGIAIGINRRLEIESKPLKTIKDERSLTRVAMLEKPLES